MSSGDVFKGLASVAPGVGSVIAGHETASATDKATAAQEKSNAAALAFEKQQAEAAYKSDETTRKANYDLYADQQARRGSVAEAFGMPARSIPAYVPGPDPHLDQTQAVPVTRLGSQPMPSVGQAAGAPAGATPLARATMPSVGDAVSGQPQIGQTKVFPNGAIGRWDGKGWLAQSGGGQ